MILVHPRQLERGLQQPGRRRRHRLLGELGGGGGDAVVQRDVRWMLGRQLRQLGGALGQPLAEPREQRVLLVEEVARHRAVQVVDGGGHVVERVELVAGLVTAFVAARSGAAGEPAGGRHQRGDDLVMSAVRALQRGQASGLHGGSIPRQRMAAQVVARSRILRTVAPYG